MLDAFFARRIDNEPIAAFRIAVAAAGLFYAVGAVQLIDVAWPAHRALATAGYAAWITVLVLLLVGWQARLMAVAGFACVLVLNGNPMAGAVGELMYRIAAFTLMFMDSGAALSVDARRARRRGAPLPRFQPRWPADVAVLSIGICIMLAGLPKLVSPVWRAGDGFYVAMLLPWTHHPWMDFVSASRPFTLGGNYLGMAVESGCVLLLFVPYARWIGIAGFVGLMFGFGAAMSFYFIGLAGLTFLPLMLPSASGAWPWHHAVSSSDGPVPGIFVRLFAVAHLSYIAIFTAASVAAVFGRTSALDALAEFRPTRVYNRYANDIRPLPLFCEVHLFGTFVYRLEGVTASGGRIELLPVFTDRGSPGPCCVAGPRYLEGLMFHVTDDAIRMSADAAYRPEAGHMTEYRAVVEKAVRSAGEPVREVRMLIKVLNPPRTFKGRVAPWDGEPWLPWMSFGVTGTVVAAEPSWLGQPPRPAYTVRS
ncbi:MAG: hypothetical protein ABIQ52_17390 [Vicinamibacterales bacterium]